MIHTDGIPTIANRRPVISVAEFETRLDNLIWREVARSDAYKNAESAEAQSEVEYDIEKRCFQELAALYEVAGA